MAVYLNIFSVMPKSDILMPAINLPNVIKQNVVVVILVNRLFDLGLAVKKPNY